MAGQVIFTKKIFWIRWKGYFRQKLEETLIAGFDILQRGAVALDDQGNIFTGTSTGGMTNKKYGRVGDSPIIGAGIYANNNSCGISATGHGEYFLRSVAAYDISALIDYKGLSLQEAADIVIHNKLRELGGEGGVIGLDSKGNIMMSFNSNGMFRGYIKQQEDPVIFIYKDWCTKAFLKIISLGLNY